MRVNVVLMRMSPAGDGRNSTRGLVIVVYRYRGVYEIAVTGGDYRMAVVHLSPELPVRGHKREPSEPGPTDFLSAGVIEGDEAPGLLQRSYSGRHRSGSSPQTLGVTNGKLRKSLRGLGRSSKAKQSAGEGNRGTSSSDAENATVQQIDSAFTKIREQLVSSTCTYVKYFSFNALTSKQTQLLVVQ